MGAVRGHSIHGTRRGMPERRADIEACKTIRWDGRAGAHFEAWCTTLSQISSGAGFRIRYALLQTRRTAAHVSVWFTSYVPDRSGANVAVAQSYSPDQFSFSDDPFSTRMGPCLLEGGRMAGMVDAHGVPVAWDLVYDPVTDPLRNLPEVFYRTRWPPSKLLTPHPFLWIGGKIEIGDHTFLLNGDPGQQGHVWGSRHADEWIWFHCSSFTSEGGDPIPGYVSGVTGRQRLSLGLLLPPLSFGHLVWEQRHVPIHPSTDWKNRRQGPWEWVGRFGDEDVSVRVSVPWEEMVLARYEDPGGHPVYCHHADRADCVVRFRAPRRPPRTFRSRGTAYLEIGSRTEDPRAERKVVAQH